MFYLTEYMSPMGTLTLASDGESVAGLWFNGQKHFMDTLPVMPVPKDDLPIFRQTRDWLDRYFGGRRPEIRELSLNPMGGTFRRTVWNLLCEIPYGEVTTYGELARRIAGSTGGRMSAQAVGGAVAHNPISVIIPCHRVVGANGNLTGYAGGLDLKGRLLTHEGVDTARFFVPK